MAENNDWTSWGIPLIIIAILPILFISPYTVIFFILIFAIRWYIRGSMYRGNARDMKGLTVVITGANTGIGKETARDLSKRGAKVIILCRNKEKGKIAAEEISMDTGNPVLLRELDLSSLASIRQCARLLNEEESSIDVLINNAGVMMTPYLETEDGFEMQLGTNHYGHFLLTLLLIEKIKASAPSRIITVSSLAHSLRAQMNWDDLDMKQNYDPMKAYGQSKLANILFTKSLAKKLEGTRVSTYALHPGVVHTELARHIYAKIGTILTTCSNYVQKFFLKDAVLGAQTTIACAVDEEFGEHTGRYYSDCKEKTPGRRAQNEEDAERLWNISLKKVGLEDFSM